MANSSLDENEYMSEEDSYLPLASQPSIIFLTSKEIFSRIENIVREVIDLLSEDFDNSLIILRNFRWNKERIENDYFNDSDKYLEDYGIRLKKLKKNVSIEILNEKSCSICFEKINLVESGLLCKHQLCVNCWMNYFNFKINDFNSTAFWKCPFDNCNLIIKHSFIFKLLPSNLYETYILKLCRTYADENKSVKWCPFPNCNYCVENIKFNRDEIKCPCSNTFCFKCSKESHKPCNCFQNSEWVLRSNSESDNLKWIQLNTKFCPKCRKPIEKNQGCNHMTCRMAGCHYEFCWLCLGDWKEHTNSTGGYYKCNKFESMNDDEKKNNKCNIDKEKSVLEKYVFYFDRFHNNRKSEENARKLLENLKNIMIRLHDEMKYISMELQFLIEGGEFLIEARRVLKYTYVYGFYQNEKSKTEKELFEFNQAWFEEFCEKLHELLESDMKLFFEKNNAKDFFAYKQRVIDITQSTKKYMNRLLDKLES